MADAEDSGKKMKITVKTPKSKQDIEIDEGASVTEFKALVAEKFEAKEEQLCLIFAGKILKDGDSLAQHKITDGLTVHLVIKSQNRSQEQAAAASTTPSTTSSSTASTPGAPNLADTPFGLGALGGLQGVGNMGMGSANFMEMQQRMQGELMGNPDFMNQMMENPMVQQMMSNPEVMRSLITSNPQMRDLMDRNPEISHMLNNPELMRQTMELARNPSMMSELMRSQDRAMSNLESLPGGFNALQRMYRDIQEPMMNAAAGSNDNPFAGLVGNNTTGENTQQGTENNAPLPNPWGGGGTGTAGTGSNSTSTTPASTPSTNQREIFNSPGMQSLMSQMTQNPQMLSNMMQAPYMSSMMETMSANPELAQQVIGGNPLFAGNPALQEQMRQQLPTMLQQMQNPATQAMLTNPRALDAVMQIQRGMQQLQQEAPGAMPGLGLPGAPPTVGSAAPATGTTTTPAAPTTDSGSTTTPAAGTTPAVAPNMANDPLSGFMAQMMGMMGTGQNNPGVLAQPPEQRYASQLEQLSSMGFINREQNITALTATLGDVNAAIDRILQSR